MRAILSKHVKTDLFGGIHWFDKIALGLGNEFESEFYFALERVKQNPDLFAADHTGYRPCRSKRFTAMLYFCLDCVLLIVIGLFATGQDESVLRNRE